MPHPNRRTISSSCGCLWKIHYHNNIYLHKNQTEETVNNLRHKEVRKNCSKKATNSEKKGKENNKVTKEQFMR